MRTTIHIYFYRALLLSVLMVTIAMPATAYDFMADSIAYSFNNNDSTTVSVVPISKTEYYKGDIVIPETVIYNGSSLTVTAIGKAAFAFCSEMTSISLPNSITAISFCAFMNCYELTEITLPNQLKLLDDCAFVSCTGLKSIKIPDSVELIGYLAFNENHSLETVVLPNSLEVIDEMTFANCWNLKNINFPESLKYIKYEAFSGCDKLTDINIPDSVVEVSSRAFAGCSKVKELRVGESVKRIANSAFIDCKWMEVLKWDAAECDDFDDIDAPFCLLFGKNFSIVIGNNVKRIPANLCRYSINLKSVDIPASVNEIGKQAFDTCFHLKTIVSRIHAPSMVNYGTDIESIFNGVDKDSCVVFVPAGTIEAYKATMPWSEFNHFEEIVENDINCDMAVTSADVTMLYNQILNNDYSSPSTCDVNGDGVVNAADITAIYNTLLGNQ